MATGREVRTYVTDPKSSVSIPSNIAEGSSQSSPQAFARFLRIALGSACETDTQLRLAKDFGYIETDVAKALINEVDGVKRMLVSLTRNFDKRRA